MSDITLAHHTEHDDSNHAHDTEKTDASTTPNGRWQTRHTTGQTLLVDSMAQGARWLHCQAPNLQ